MLRIEKTIVRGFLVLGVALAVTACSSRSSTPPPTGGGGGGTTARQEDQFGAQFAAAFRADPNSEPYSPNDGDIVAISLTAEPVDVK